MNKQSLERGQRIVYELERIKCDLKELRDTKENPGSRLMWGGNSISPKAHERIRIISINSLVSRRRVLNNEFKKL